MFEALYRNVPFSSKCSRLYECYRTTICPPLARNVFHFITLVLAWQELRRCRLISIIEVEFRNVDAAAVVSPPVKFFT